MKTNANIYLEIIKYNRCNDKENKEFTYAIKYEDDIGNSKLFGSSNSANHLANSTSVIKEIYDEYIIELINLLGFNNICISIDDGEIIYGNNFINDIQNYIKSYII